MERVLQVNFQRISGDAIDTFGQKSICLPFCSLSGSGLREVIHRWKEKPTVFEADIFHSTERICTLHLNVSASIIESLF
jgi:hypothetical protein